MKTYDIKSSITYFPKGAGLDEKLDIISNIKPSKRQMEWQRMEFYAFIHFTVNTFTDNEWGNGDESEDIFNPVDLDCRQWAETAKKAGMKQIIITAKHHDGFCLWPSAYTKHSVKNCPWKDGNGDIVKELSRACSEFGLKLGIYLSPWDRYNQSYGTDSYNDYFVNQLTELLTNYGEINCVWFDGACGEGPYGKRQVYDWQRYYSTIRALQPDAVISVMGPDTRWVGTESGYGRDTEWSALPCEYFNTDMIAGNSQQEAGEGSFIPESTISNQSMAPRSIINKSIGAIWYPAEIDVSIRPGWFYHEKEDHLVKTPVKLLDHYFCSIGKNGTLLLNLTPDKRGLIPEGDRDSLIAFAKIRDSILSDNKLKDAEIFTSGSEDVSVLIDDDFDSFTEFDDIENEIFIKMPCATEINAIEIMEYIEKGQAVEEFLLTARVDGLWQKIGRGTTIGYKRIVQFKTVKADAVKIVISMSRRAPILRKISLYMVEEKFLMQPVGEVVISKGSELNVKTQIKTLISDKRSMKVLQNVFGDEMLSSDMIDVIKEMTLEEISAMHPDQLSFTKLVEINKLLENSSKKNDLFK